MRKLIVAAVAGVVVSLTAGCGTADGLNNGDPVPSASVSPKAEGDSAWYPNVGNLPKYTPRPTGRTLRLPKGFKWVRCPNSRTYMACFKPA